MAAFAGAALAADTDWPLCGEGLQIPERPVSEASESTADPETFRVSADSADIVEDGVTRLTGNVAVEGGTRLLRSDEIVYDESEGVIEAKGNVRYWDEGTFVAGENARAELETDAVTVESVTAYMLEGAHGHGEARDVEIIGNERMTASGASFTTCNPGDADWRITADRLTIDQAEGTAEARNLWLRVMGQRLFYLPRLSFPLSSRRKSGFLAPSWGSSESSGIEVTAPFYFNLAPNYDATLAARAMSKRGVQARGELRFLARGYGSGRIAAEHLPSDARFDGDRTAFDLSHRHEWSDRWSTDARLEQVSDASYLQDLGDGLSQSSRSYLPRRLDVTYRGEQWDALLRIQDFQTLDPSILPHDQPYTRLPQIVLRTNAPQRNRALNVSGQAEVTYFQRDSFTTGARASLRPSVTYPIHTAGIFVTPKATLHLTRYELDRIGAETSLDGEPTSLVPAFSLDGGMSLERPLTLEGRSLTHTVEPRLYYLIVPFGHQSDLPNFDTSEFSFNFARLFRENRFSGGDRIGDTHQLTLGLTSRLLDEHGAELVRASLGRVAYFRDRWVQLDRTDPPETRRASDLLAEIEARPARKWRLRTSLQYDPMDRRNEASAFHVQYRSDRRRLFNLAYRRVRDIEPEGTIEQADLSFVWPIANHWRTIGRWNVALDGERNQTLEAFGGLAYESCCFMFRAMARRYLSHDERGADGDRYSNGIYVQVEFKGLTGTGIRPHEFLIRGIPGYENEF